MNALVHKKLVAIPYREDVHNLLPESREVRKGSRRLLVLNHGVAETKILRNLGISVSAPILSQYSWAGTKPFESQKNTAALLSTEPRAYCLSSMGVGKTRSALYAYDYMRQENFLENLLVVAPLSTLVDVWEREIFECFHHLRVSILHGTKAQRLKALEEDADVYIINHDGVATILNELAEKRFGAIVIDELAAFRNSQTKRWKMLNYLINKAGQPVVWGLTGSPTPNAPTDAYGQVKLLTSHQVPRSFRQFQLQTMTQVSQFRWVAKGDANETVAAAMKPSIRYTLDECHDIPATTYSMRHIAPSPMQTLVYQGIVDRFRAEFKGHEITALNEGAKIAKLLQISAGFAYDDGKGAYIDAKARLKEVVNLIEQSDSKVLVFANFKWIVRALAEVVGKYFSVETITGDTKKSDRDQTFAKFRKAKDPRVIIAHPGTMAHGLTLVEATTIIWYGPPQSSEIYEQANARIRRTGQDKHTHVICIESTPAEKSAFQRLQRRQKMQGLLLDLFQGSEDDA